MKLKARAYLKLAAKDRHSKYNYVGEVSEDPIPTWTRLNGKYGLEDGNGKELTPPKYDYIDGFSHGLARVKLEDLYGFIDKKGMEIVQPKYTSVDDFQANGLAEVRLGDYKTGKKGLIDKQGKEVFSLGLYSSFTPYLNCIVVEKEIDKVTYCGLLDMTGKELTTFKYSQMHSINRTQDPVIFRCALKKENKTQYGLVDSKGKPIVPIGTYAAIHYFYQGLCKVSNDSHDYGFIDTTGKEVVPIGKYLRIRGDFEMGLPLATERESYREIHIDKEGNPFETYKINGPFCDGFAAVERDGKYGFINAKGELAISLEYDYAWDFSEGLAAVELNDKMGSIDVEGKEVIPLKYNHVDRCLGDLVRVNKGAKISKDLIIKGGKWGYVNKQGVEVVPLGQYYFLKKFEKGLGQAQIKKEKWLFATGGEWILINAKGKQATLESYSDIKRIESNGNSNYIVQKNDMYGRLNSSGKEVIPSKFKSAEDIIKFENALAAGASKKRILDIMMPETQETK